MKQFLAIIAFGTVLAEPAFAQQAPNTCQDAQALHPRVHVYAAEYYEPRHAAPNPQSGPAIGQQAAGWRPGRQITPRGLS